MSSVVIDASIAFAWALPSQRTVSASMLSQRESFMAPSLFAFELRAGMLAAERNRRLSRPIVEREIAAILALVELAPSPDEDTHAATLATARATGISFYGACYLELAHRERAELASRDGPLLGAATRLGVAVYDAR